MISFKVKTFNVKEAKYFISLNKIMLFKRLKYIYVINIQKLAEQILRKNIILYNDLYKKYSISYK